MADVTAEENAKATEDESAHAQQDQDVTSSFLTEDYGESSVDLQDGTTVDSSALDNETGEIFEDDNSAISEALSTPTPPAPPPPPPTTTTTSTPPATTNTKTSVSDTIATAYTPTTEADTPTTEADPTTTIIDPITTTTDPTTTNTKTSVSDTIATAYTPTTEADTLKTATDTPTTETNTPTTETDPTPTTTDPTTTNTTTTTTSPTVTTSVDVDNEEEKTKVEAKASRRSQRISTKSETGSHDASEEAGKSSSSAVRHIHSCLAMRKRKYRKDEEASKEMERTIRQHHDTSDYEQISVAVRPWVRLNGTLNRRVLDRLLGAVLNLVMERPGISARDIVCRFSPALQPAHTHDLLDTLVQIRCIVPLELRRSHKPSLFSDTVNYTLEPAELHDCEDEVLYEPMVDAILKLAMFIGDKKYSQDFLSGDRR